MRSPTGSTVDGAMRLARLIIDSAQRSGLSREAGVASDLNPDEALRKIDAWLCDLKDLAVKDGLHVYGRAGAAVADPAWAGKRRDASARPCSPRSTASA